MLHLLAPTDVSWVSAAEADLDRLLSDHAHCELKAAQSALGLVGRYGGEHPEMVAPLTALAREEASHFREVHQHLESRGASLGLPNVDGYVKALREAARMDHQDHPALLDRLLVCCLIEARSCERFKLLAERLSPLTLRAFYRGLMVSEAKHFRLFADLAEASFGAPVARQRLRTLAAREAEVASMLPLGPTVHG
jgi:tRNA 2-(methylsulfanyl)-N6-isopentenyladenosine37 hydroxylase